MMGSSGIDSYIRNLSGNYTRGDDPPPPHQGFLDTLALISQFDLFVGRFSRQKLQPGNYNYRNST